MTNGLAAAGTLIRWSARVLSAVILLFWGVFLVAHMVGGEGQGSRPLTSNDLLILAGLTGSLVGLALAWRWELVGAALALVAIAICAFANWRVLVFPGALIPVTAMLFVASWWVYRHRETATPHG